MPVLNPQHLLEQAAQLLDATPGHKPRQVNLRRSVSSAYYAVFHHVLIAAADEFIGKSLRSDPRYTLVYRSIEHGAIRRTCDEAARLKPSPKIRKCLSSDSFEPKIRSFSNIFLRLQQLRHDADYDAGQTLTSVDSLYSIHLAREAIEEFNSASGEGRKFFLTVLLFPPR